MSEERAGGDVLAGVILAGGRARRMGGAHKALLELGGRPLVARVAGRLKPQVAAMALNANERPGSERAARLADFGLPVIADTVEGFAGPLAGILAGMKWAAREVPGARFVLSVAVDTPFFPSDMGARLLAALRGQGAGVALAASGGRVHPVSGLWPLAMMEEMERALVEEGLRKVEAFAARYRAAVVEFPAASVDPFFNINTPDDLREAERLVGSSR